MRTISNTAMTYRHLILISAVLLMNACSPARPPAPQYEYEIVGVEEQALEAIAAMPTEFRVSFEDDEAVWDRSHLFFKTYTQGALSQDFDYPVPGTTLRSRSENRERYRYEIERSLVSGGYRYLVLCEPGNSTAHLCDRNARNVARFLRDGHLELSLLDR